MTVGVLATLRVEGANAERVRDALLALAEHAAHEPGTELFEVHETIDHIGQFVIFERYCDEAAVLVHRTSAAMDCFRAVLRQAEVRPDIVFLTPL